MDDASSISSGEISDAVAGVSTDDNITVGSSLSAHSCTDQQAAALANQRAAVLHMGSVTLQTSSARRHAAAAATDRSALTAAGGRTGPLTAAAGHGAVFIRRSNQAVVTDLKARTLRSGTAVAIDDPPRCLATVAAAASSSSSSSVVKQKRDSETNTDNSALMMLAQRSRLAAEYGGSGSGGHARRLTTAVDLQSARSSSLGRTQSDCARSSTELQSSRKHSAAMSETDDYDVGRTAGLLSSRCRADSDQLTAAPYHSDVLLSASGGQYIIVSTHFTYTHNFLSLCFCLLLKNWLHFRSYRKFSPKR